MKQEDCYCREGRVNGRPIHSSMHDCMYVERRGRLIPQAEQAADEAMNAARRLGQSTTKGRWNRAFHDAMTRLCFEAGLTGRPLERMPLQLLPDLPAEA